MEMRRLMTATSTWPSKRNRLGRAEPTAIYRLTTSGRLQGAATLVINQADTASSSVIGPQLQLAGGPSALSSHRQKADRTIQYP